MSEIQNKRRRLGAAPTTEETRPRPSDCDTARDMKRVLGEVEPIALKRKDQTIICYRPTYRATIAKKGYLLKQTLGTGSYSKVKLGVNVNGEKVAVKIVDRAKAPSDFQQRFLPRELKYWPTLNHANLVKLRCCFEDSWRVYMILEYLERGNVLQYVQSHNRIAENVAKRWTYQIIDAIRYMHDKDITHRDLKLENLLLDTDLNIKICDFGFIKPSSTKNLSVTFCGSKSYAAPEILQGRPYDPKKADVWAIGVILYIMITGRMPFDETKGTKHILKEQKSLAFHWSSSLLLSDECKDLIMTIFTWDFNARASIHDIINHPWFTMAKCEPAGTGNETTSAGMTR